MALTQRQIELVQYSFTQIKADPDTVATLFYGRLFELDPSLRPLFHGDMQEQGRKLMTMLKVAVTSLDKLGTIVGAVQELGRRHAGYHVTPQHYDTVGAALLWTLRQGLGPDDFNPEVEAAWTETYTTLAKVMIDAAREPELVAA